MNTDELIKCDNCNKELICETKYPMYMHSNNMDRIEKVPLREKDLLEIGFEKTPHFTVGNIMIYKLGRNRLLQIGNVGTPNEMLTICETDFENEEKITDLVCLHNYDYDGGYCTLKNKNVS